MLPSKIAKNFEKIHAHSEKGTNQFRLKKVGMSGDLLIYFFHPFINDNFNKHYAKSIFSAVSTYLIGFSILCF